MQEGADTLAEEAAKVPRVSPEELKEKLAIKSVYIVDTRSVSYLLLECNYNCLIPINESYKIVKFQAPEYAARHIPGTVNIPLGAEGGVNLSVEDGNFCIWVSLKHIVNF